MNNILFDNPTLAKAWQALDHNAFLWPPRSTSQEEQFIEILNKEIVQKNLRVAAPFFRKSEPNPDLSKVLEWYFDVSHQLGLERRANYYRLQACYKAGDIAGQIEALHNEVKYQPTFVDSWIEAAFHLEVVKSPAASLNYLRQGEPFVGDQLDYRYEVIRLTCVCGTRAEALAESQILRQLFNPFWESIIQINEDYLLAWRTDEDAVRRRQEWNNRSHKETDADDSWERSFKEKKANIRALSKGWL